MRRLFAIVLALQLLANTPSGAAGFSDYVVDDPTLRQLFDEFEREVEAYATRRAANELGTGGNSRGGSAAIAAILTSADTVTCASWIITFRRAYLDLLIEDDPPPPPELLSKAHDLLQGVIAGCREVLDPESCAEVSDSDYAPDPETVARAPQPLAYRFGVPVWTEADAVCLHRCDVRFEDYEDARLAVRGRTFRLNRQNDEVEHAFARLDDLDRQIRTAEIELSSARLFASDGADTSAVRLQQAEAALLNLNAERAALISEVTGRQAEIAETASAYLDLAADALDTLTLYQQCMARCATSMRDRETPSGFAETLLDVVAEDREVHASNYTNVRDLDAAYNVLWITLGGYKGADFPTVRIDIDGRPVETLSLTSEALLPYRIPVGFETLRRASVIRITPLNPDDMRGFTVWQIDVPIRGASLRLSDAVWAPEGGSAQSAPSIIRGAGVLSYALSYAN